MSRAARTTATARRERTTGILPAARPGIESPGRVARDRVFVFFSNRLGCLGSLLVSVILTVVLLVILNVL
jgi:hypothetical protein